MLGNSAEACVARCDVTDPAEVDEALAATLAAFDGRIDLLVNIAGGSGVLGKPFWENAPEEFDHIIGRARSPARTWPSTAAG